jgi:hypothetical protein
VPGTAYRIATFAAVPPITGVLSAILSGKE